MQWIVSFEMIGKLNSSLKQDYLQAILREPLETGSLGVSCTELIHTDNNRWIGIDWFSDQPTYEACLKLCENKKVNRQSCPCNKFFKVNE
jgi:hypothetical protein